MALFSHLFYFAGIFFIILELTKASSAEKYVDVIKRVRNNERYNKKKMGLFVIVQLSYMIWSVMGLMSDQWLLFLFLLVISFIPSNKDVTACKIDGYFTSALLVFMIINQYHLGITFF